LSVYSGLRKPPMLRRTNLADFAYNSRSAAIC